MNIWGIDVGTTNIAATRMTPEGEPSVNFVKFDSNLDPGDIHNLIHDFIRDLDPGSEDRVYIESVFYRFSIKTLIRLSRVAHSIYTGFYPHVSLVEYVDNNTWRSSLFGTSRIKKEACQEQAYIWWNFLQQYPKSKRGHLADSVCIAEYGRKLL